MRLDLGIAHSLGVSQNMSLRIGEEFSPVSDGLMFDVVLADGRNYCVDMSEDTIRALRNHLTRMLTKRVVARL